MPITNAEPITDEKLEFIAKFGGYCSVDMLLYNLLALASRIKVAEAKVVEVTEEGRKKYDDVLFSLRDILWPEDDPGKEFGADTYDEIVALLNKHGITPPGE